MKKDLLIRLFNQSLTRVLIKGGGTTLRGSRQGDPGVLGGILGFQEGKSH